MFKFLREIRESIREGVAEGRAEAEQERLGLAGDEPASDALKAADLSTVPAAERFGVALAAPYREVFLGTLGRSSSDRSAAFLQTLALPEPQVADFAKLLKRDFEATDGPSLRAADEVMAEAGDEHVLILVRRAHLIAGGCGVGWLPYDEALTRLEAVADAARATCDGWASFGERFLAEERHASGSNPLGRKFLAGVIKKLGEHEASPWRIVDWA